MAHKVLPRAPREGPDQRWYSDIENAITHYDVTLDPASVAANTTEEQLFTLTGINSLDVIIVNKPSVTTGLGIVGARASARDQIAITFINATGGAINPASEEYRIIAIRG